MDSQNLLLTRLLYRAFLFVEFNIHYVIGRNSELNVANMLIHAVVATTK